MPTVTIIKFEGSEEEIARFVAQNGHNTPASPGTSSNPIKPTNAMWDNVSSQFQRYVQEAASAGRPSQRDAMLAWLRSGGTIALKKLWSAAGVKAQHDYAGVGGSLTKNMVKAKGPKAWYTWHLDKSGEWIYEIILELRDPLKRAFGI